MSTRRKDTTILIFMTALIGIGMWYFYSGIDERKTASDVNLYGLVIPGPQAILSINRPLIFDKIILPKKNIGQAFKDHIPAIYLDLIHENEELPLFLFSFYPQGAIVYAPMADDEARQIFGQLDAHFPFKPQHKKENDISYRYYPEKGNRFFGCYFHKGVFVASYNRKLLEQTAKRQQIDSLQVIPELMSAKEKTNQNSLMNLFIPSNTLDLYVQITEITEWRIKDQWLGIDLFLNEDNLCLFNTQPYQTSLDSLFYQPGLSSFTMWNNTEYRLNTLYECMGDTIGVRINQLFPQIKTTVQVSHDEAVAYFTIFGS